MTPEPILDLAAARVFADGSGGPVRLDHPEGVAVHPDGSVWCGGEAGQVYRIAPDGSSVELRVADDEGFTLALAFGPDGLLYYVDGARRAVMRLDPAGGEPEPLARERSAGTSWCFRTRSPSIAPGRLYVTESNSPSEPGPGIFRIDPDGTGSLWSSGPFLFANGDRGRARPERRLRRRDMVAPHHPRARCTTTAPQADRSRSPSCPTRCPTASRSGPTDLLYVACYQPSQIIRIDGDGERRRC